MQGLGIFWFWFFGGGFVFFATIVTNIKLKRGEQNC